MPDDQKKIEKNKLIMTQGEKIEVELLSHEGARQSGEVRYQKLDEKERNWKATKFLLACVGAAFVFVILPPHILWFMGLITTGVVGYFLKKKQGDLILGGQGTCPSCNKFQILEACSAEFPLLHYCSECRSRSEIYKRGDVRKDA